MGTGAVLLFWRQHTMEKLSDLFVFLTTAKTILQIGHWSGMGFTDFQVFIVAPVKTIGVTILR